LSVLTAELEILKEKTNPKNENRPPFRMIGVAGSRKNEPPKDWTPLAGIYSCSRDDVKLRA